MKLLELLKFSNGSEKNHILQKVSPLNAILRFFYLN